MAEHQQLLSGGGEVVVEENNCMTKTKRFIHRPIEEEILPEHQWTVKLCYWSWWFFIFGMSWNILTISLAITGKTGHCGKIGPILLSSLLWVLLIPAVFIVYVLLYKACQKGSQLYFCLYLVLNVIYVGTLILFLVGPCNIGVGGLIFMIKEFNKKKWLGFFVLVQVLVWIICLLIQLWVLFKSYRAYREVVAGNQQQSGGQADSTQAQVLDYAYQNRQAIYEAQAALPSANRAAAETNVYQQPDDARQTAQTYQQTLQGGAAAQAYSFPSSQPESYDPRSVFG